MHLDNYVLAGQQIPRLDEFKLDKLYTKMTGKPSGFLYIFLLLIRTFLLSCLIFCLVIAVLWFVSAIMLSSRSGPCLWGISALSMIVFAAFFIQHNIKEKMQLKKILKYGVETTGEIVDLKYVDRKPTLIKYSYKDETGREYVAKQRPWNYEYPNTLNLGDPFPVYYLSEDPSRSILDYSQAVKNYDIIDEKKENTCIYEVEFSPGPANIDSMSFARKFYSKMKIYYPQWWAYLLILLIFCYEPFMLLKNNEIDFSGFLQMALDRLPALFIVYIIELILHQLINFLGFSIQKNLYAQGSSTMGRLLSCDTSIMDHIRFSRHGRFPSVPVSYVFKTPSGDEYTASVNLPVPEKMPSVKIGDSYPVYYDPRNPLKSTIDIFGFTDNVS